MPLVKICPTCKTENAISEILCCNCMSDISAINQIDTYAICCDTRPCDAQSCDVPVVEDTLSLSCGDFEIEISDGKIIGRTFFSDKYPQHHERIPKTVSRKHAKFTKCDSGWTVEDVGSTNGTWLNGKKLTPQSKLGIISGDVVHLSRSFKIKIEVK